MTDFAPSGETSFHQTLSINPYVLLEGAIELTVAQRMIYLIVDVARPVLAAGRELKKDMNVLAGEYADADKEKGGEDGNGS